MLRLRAVCQSATPMHESRRQFADRLYAESHAHDQGRPRLERFRNVEPPTAELLGVLIRAVGAGLRVAVRDPS